MSGSVFVLSGEELTLPYAEIRALAQTYAPKEACEKLGGRVVYTSISDSEIISKITSRAAFCRFGGHFVSKSEKVSSIADDLKMDLGKQGKTFAVSSETLDRETYGDVGAAIKAKTLGKVSLEHPDYVFQVEATDSGFVLGVTTSGYKEFSWRKRRPRARKFFLPSAIYPKLARLLVNLSRVREGEIFLDPFCGTGSLLIESSLMGMRTVGIDLTRWIARGALLNLKGFSLSYDSIIRADASSRYLPFSKVDAVSTDVPYGRAASTKGKATGQLIKEFTSALSESMSSGKARFCVIMHPSHVELDFERKSFQLEEQHLLYVHRNLTRAISVLRRI